jgi:hypothetical protein
MAVALAKLTTYPPLFMQNNWYYSGNVVTGASSEEATRILQEIQNVSQGLYNQTQQFAQAEMFHYIPYILLICGILLAGGVISTFFIWRSVIVPTEVSEAIAAGEIQERKQRRTAPGSLANLLSDDGELHDSEAEPLPEHNHQEK